MSGRMSMHASQSPSFADLFTPKLVTVLREGYTAAKFRADALAGLTVAIVALPLSMAIAIASGAPPQNGLVSAVIGGFVVSALGGSRFQIGGPAGAFIVLVAATIERHGYDGFLLATMLAGAILALIGLLRLGTYIKYIPQPVVVGFTAGIAVIIFASQIRDLLGLALPGREPAALLPKLAALGAALPTLDPSAAMLSLGTVAIIAGLRRWRPAAPGMLIALAVASLATYALGLPVETIGTRFGALPSGLPAPSFPPVDAERIVAVLPDAIAIAFLGGIESLLSAVVADGMSGRRHRSNCELVAQGIANMAAGLFGGICVTGTIARTATNVRAGAVGPVAGMMHAVFLFAFMAVAAPAMGYVPLPALAAVLVVVAWNMAERHAFAGTLRHSRGEAFVLLATFLLTIVEDLTVGISVGVVLGSFLFMHRMAEMVAVEIGAPLIEGDRPDRENGARAPYEGEAAAEDGTMVYRIAGPLFFGAAATVANVLERVGAYPKILILDLSAVPFVDSTGAASLASIARRARGHGARVVVAGARPPVMRALAQAEVKPPLVAYAASVAEARLVIADDAKR